MKQKIRVALIYKNNYNYFDPNHFDRTTSDFFLTSLQKHSRLEMLYFPSDNSFDATKIKGKCDVVLLANNYTDATPENLHGIKELGVPVVSRVGDPHHAIKYEQISYHDQWNVTCYFGTISENYFHKFYPNRFRYETVIFGLEPSRYQNLKPFKDRIKNRILNSGATGNLRMGSRVANAILNPRRSGWYFYKLRTLCNKLSYVDYSGIRGSQYPNVDYPIYLSQYRSAIAATTYYPTQKYWEIPAAGCLTFMESTETNDCSYLGFIDNETAIFINKKNYKKKFENFLTDPDNPKWEEIAIKGRQHVFKNLSNDQAANSLVKLMSEFI